MRESCILKYHTKETNLTKPQSNSFMWEKKPPKQKQFNFCYEIESCFSIFFILSYKNLIPIFTTLF
jgi:hypothetical protein